MTRCYKSNSTLKSSVFNQTGQTFIDQIEVQRTLCAHFRRILSAKSVVDSRNPRYMKMMQRKSRPSTAKKFLIKCPSDETIEKLAYDTEHHPCDLVRVQCRSKSTSHDRSWSGDRQRPINSDANCPRPKAHTSRDRSSTGKLHGKNQKRPANTSRSQQRAKDKLHDATSRGTRSRRCNYELNSERRSDGEALGRSPDSTRGQQLQESGLWRFEEQCCQGEEEARYARFVYDITQEIVHNGLYTDREFKEVFEKHLRKNSGHLSRRKMLYEIYQLKISLNMMDDTEDEDEVEADLVYAEKFSNHRVPKPPTPPKILNENKVIEKLESFKQFECSRQLDTPGDATAVSTPGRKCVTLVDANPEFLVTERDVLSTLADNQVKPYQIERICRNLYQKSRDMSLCEAVQVGSEVAYTYRLKQVDRCTSAGSLSDAYYSKKESRGILRKDCGTASKSLSPISFYKFGFGKVKRYDGQEKCARWATDECDCEEQVCHGHMEPPERLRKSSCLKIQENASKAEPTKCDCSCGPKHHANEAEIPPRPQKRSSLKFDKDKSVQSNDRKKSEKFEDGEAASSSENTIPPLKLKRRSAVSVHNEEEKWKKEDSQKEDQKENAQSRVPRKLGKFSDEEKSQSQKLSKSSSREKNQSRKTNKLSEQEKDQSQNSNKSAEQEKGQSQKSSKSSNKNKNQTERPDKLAEKEVDETATAAKKNSKGRKSQSSKSASARRSSSESSLSDIQPEVRNSPKTRNKQENFSVPQTPVIMRSRLPSERSTIEKIISTESSEVSSESDEPIASGSQTRRHTSLSTIASKGSVEDFDRLTRKADGEENGNTRSPDAKSRRVSLTTSPDTSNRTSGELDLDYSKFPRRSSVESRKESGPFLEPSSEPPQERKKDVPKDRTASKVVSKSISEISKRSDSISNKSTLSEHERLASPKLNSRVLINMLHSPESSKSSIYLTPRSKPFKDDDLYKKLEKIQSANDVRKDFKGRNNRNSSVLIENDAKSPKMRDENEASSNNDESSEIEEIEEEIETASEPTSRSPRGQIKETLREADKKREMFAREAAKALMEEEEEDEDDEEKYSDDFSDASDSPRRSDEAVKVPRRRMPSMRDFLESFAQANEPRAPYVSSGSSGSGATSILSLNVASDSLDPTIQSTPSIKRRTSSGASGYKVMESWNERLSELSGDLYVDPATRLCDPRCRSSLVAKTCSADCKFAKTNCYHIKEPTDCFDEDNSSGASGLESSPYL